MNPKSLSASCRFRYGYKRLQTIPHASSLGFNPTLSAISEIFPELKLLGYSATPLANERAIPFGDLQLVSGVVVLPDEIQQQNEDPGSSQAE
jgi:hypothetical protein